MLRMRPDRCGCRTCPFFSWDHFPNKILPAGAILDLTPDLAIEVLSPRNTKREMARKRREYFLGGTRLVWEVDPNKRTVRVYTAPDESALLRRTGRSMAAASCWASGCRSSSCSPAPASS